MVITYSLNKVLGLVTVLELHNMQRSCSTSMTVCRASSAGAGRATGMSGSILCVLAVVSCSPKFNDVLAHLWVFPVSNL